MNKQKNPKIAANRKSMPSKRITNTPDYSKRCITLPWGTYDTKFCSWISGCAITQKEKNNDWSLLRQEETMLMMLMQSFKSSRTSQRSPFGQHLTCHYGKYRLVASYSERFLKNHISDHYITSTPKEGGQG